MTEAQAKAIQSVYGGAIEQTGGNHWRVVVRTPQGGVMTFTDEVILVYANEHDFNIDASVGTFILK